MSKPAARIGDMHVCPMVTPGVPPIPHVGGPITGPGVPTVLIAGMPAAVMGDMCVCTGPPDTIVLGSTGVLIGGKPAARMGDMCAHGGSIVVGAPNVLIGEMAPGASPGVVSVVNTFVMQMEGFEGGEAASLVARQTMSLTKAAETGAPFCEICEKKREKAEKNSKSKKSNHETSEVVKTIHTIYFIDEDGNAISEIEEEKKVFLKVEGKNIAGEEVLINFHDNPKEFTYQGKELESNELILTLSADEELIELGININTTS